MKREQSCFNCGKDLGIYDHYPGELECCGAQECQRELRNQMRAEREARMFRAEEDEYGRYA
jgi:hypothetical protein